MSITIYLPDDWEEEINKAAKDRSVDNFKGWLKIWINRWIRYSAGQPEEEKAAELPKPSWKIIEAPEQEYPTLAARRIMEELVPDWRELFLAKNRHYGETADYLGIKGQFADINRKFWPLKRALWDDVDSFGVGEPVEEIIKDLIGHLFLALDMLGEENAGNPMGYRYGRKSQ